MTAHQRARVKERVCLVFGEDEHDKVAIAHLTRALWTDAPRIEIARNPLILIKGRQAAEQRKNASKVADVVRAHGHTREIVAVLAHQDADAIEPAHTAIATDIEEKLKSEGVPNPCAVVPAWEMESWWFLWPKQLAAVNPRWKNLSAKVRHTGMIRNAKETLCRELRPPRNAAATNDYCEADSVRIARKVKEDAAARNLHGTSESYLMFVSKIDKIREKLSAP